MDPFNPDTWLVVKGRLPARSRVSNFSASLDLDDAGKIRLRVDDGRNPEFWLEISVDVQAIEHIRSLLITEKADRL